MALIQCPECRKAISDKAQACPHCGAPVISPEALAQQGKTPPMPGCLIAFIILISIVVILIVIGPIIGGPDTPEKRRANCVGHGEEEAHYYAEQSVTSRLKAPTTAEDHRTTHTEGCDFHVDGHVDAQNGFGAKIRSAYSADLSYNPDDETWSVTNVIIVGQ